MNFNLKKVVSIKSKWLILAFFNLIVLGLFSVLTLPKGGFKASDIQAFATQLSNIHLQLIKLQQEAKKPAEKTDLRSIDQEFNKLSHLIEQLKSQESNKLSQLLSENRSELIRRFDAIQQAIHALDQKQHPIQYLPPTALPFKVLSIDSIQQISVASVAYDYKTVPLEKSDKLAGWTVLHIDFAKQRLELENANKERVVVTLATKQGDENA